VRGAIAAVLLVVAGAPAAAQPAPRFPVNQSFKAISISGYDVQNKGLSMTITHKGGDYRGAGQAGCNHWSASVILRDREIDFINIVTTKKRCAKATMTAEEAFLSSLRQARRWHIERDNVIIEGDAARLLLKPGVARLKPERSPAKKRRSR
jgi:heat shock protein HslJ